MSKIPAVLCFFTHWNRIVPIPMNECSGDHKVAQWQKISLNGVGLVCDLLISSSVAGCVGSTCFHQPPVRNRHVRLCWQANFTPNNPRHTHTILDSNYNNHGKATALWNAKFLLFNREILLTAQDSIKNSMTHSVHLIETRKITIQYQISTYIHQPCYYTISSWKSSSTGLVVVHTSTRQFFPSVLINNIYVNQVDYQCKNSIISVKHARESMRVWVASGITTKSVIIWRWIMYVAIARWLFIIHYLF